LTTNATITVHIASLPKTVILTQHSLRGHTERVSTVQFTLLVGCVTGNDAVIYVAVTTVHLITSLP